MDGVRSGKLEVHQREGGKVQSTDMRARSAHIVLTRFQLTGMAAQFRIIFTQD